MKRSPARNRPTDGEDVGEIAKLVYDPVIGKHMRKEPQQKFIMGPIPFEWMRKANALPGSAGQVGVALWFLRGVRQSMTFPFTAEAEALSGSNRKAYYKGLTELEKAGLVQVKRKRGRRPIVTILT